MNEHAMNNAATHRLNLLLIALMMLFQWFTYYFWQNSRMVLAMKSSLGRVMPG